MLKIATICSGNICRSPMAAVLLEHKLKQRERSAMIISAGTLNIIGRSAAIHAREAVAAHGLSLESHRSQGINNKLVTFADHVIIMAPHHGVELLKLYPKLEPKLVGLWRYAPEETPGWPLTEIADPVGQSLAQFLSCRDLIDQCLDAWIAQALETPQA